jgi:hypothetical protein
MLTSILCGAMTASLLTAAVLPPLVAGAVGGQTVSTIEHEIGQFTERLHGDDRVLADAYARSTWVHANVLAGEWDRANFDLGHVQKDLRHLLGKKQLSAQSRSQLELIEPIVKRLDAQIKARDRLASATAKDLVATFGTAASQLATMGWFAGRGGGAGRGGEQPRPR